MSNKSRMIIHIRFLDIIYFIGWFLIFTPPILFRISGLVTSLIRLMTIIYFVFIAVVVQHRYYYHLKSCFLKWAVVFCLWATTIVAIKSPGQLIPFFYEQLLPLIGCVMLIRRGIMYAKPNVEDRLRGLLPLYWLCVLYIIINFATIILFPNGLFQSNLGSSVERANWLLGSKNNQSPFLIMAVLMILLFMKKSFRNRLMNEAMVVIAAISICITGENKIELMGGSSSGIIAIAFLCTISLFLVFKKDIPFTEIKFRWIFSIFLILYLIIILGVTLPFILKIIEVVLHKDMTFSNRTLIWQQVIYYIIQKPLTGFGEIPVFFPVKLASWISGTTYVYNMLLKYILDFGFIGLALFVLPFFKLPKYQNSKYQIMVIGICSYLIIGFMNEIDFSYIMFFPILIETVFYNYKNIDNKKIRQYR